MNRLVDNELFTDFDVSSSYDSKGRPLSVKQNDFFRASKCVDASGRLLVLYHASNSNFTVFDPAKIGTGGGAIYGKGFYFCDSDFGLDIYGKHIKEYYLNLKNPFIWGMTDETITHNLNKFIKVLEQNNFVVSRELRRLLEEDLLENYGGLDTVIEMTCGVDSAREYFIQAGYDGIMNLEIGDYVAFKPEQIKLCSNKNPSASTDVAA